MAVLLSDLARHKDTQPLLLGEVKQVLAGKPFHDLTQAHLNKMTKVDSFIKESQRLSPNATIGLARKIIKPGGITLSNNLLLPQNTYVAVSRWSIMRDPDLWTNPEDFDALRFQKLGQKPGDETKHQFVTLADTSIGFSAEPFARLGRLLVHNELKIVVAFLLLNYQIAIDDQPGGKSTADESPAGEEARVSFTLKQ